MKSIKAEAGIKVSIAALTRSVLIIIHYQSPGFFPKMWTVVTGGNVKYIVMNDFTFQSGTKIIFGRKSCGQGQLPIMTS